MGKHGCHPPGTYDHAAHLLNFSYFAMGSQQIQSILCPHSFVTEAEDTGASPYYEANILGTAKYPSHCPNPDHNPNRYSNATLTVIQTQL